MHFQVRVGVFNCQLTKICLFVFVFCAEMYNNFYQRQKAINIMLADHVISTGHNIKWDHFEIIATGKPDLQCKIKETLLISELKPSLNENIQR